MTEEGDNSSAWEIIKVSSVLAYTQCVMFFSLLLRFWDLSCAETKICLFFWEQFFRYSNSFFDTLGFNFFQWGLHSHLLIGSPNSRKPCSRSPETLKNLTFHEWLSISYRHSWTISKFFSIAWTTAARKETIQPGYSMCSLFIHLFDESSFFDEKIFELIPLISGQVLRGFIKNNLCPDWNY